MPFIDGTFVSYFNGMNDGPIIMGKGHFNLVIESEKDMRDPLKNTSKQCQNFRGIAREITRC